MNFDLAVELIIAAEGLHSDDPDDAGGDTWFGISRRAFPELEPWPPSREVALALYRKHYWDACRCDELPEALRLAVFDAAVNQGAGATIRRLQLAAGVKADGVIGRQTLFAVTSNPANVRVDFLARRAMAYAEHPQFKKFGLGWLRRLFKVSGES